MPKYSDLNDANVAIDINGFSYTTDEPSHISRFGGVNVIEFIESTGFLLLVGNSTLPTYSKRKLVVYDCENDEIYNTVECEKNIIAIRHSLDKIFLVMEDRIDVVNFPDMNWKVQVSTYYKNIYGLCEVSNYLAQSSVMVYPTSSGTIMVTDPKYLQKKDRCSGKQIRCHENDLIRMALSKDGKYLATASVIGTLIRIWCIVEECVHISVDLLRRGTDYAKISSLSFSRDNKYLSCSSDKLSIHLFRVDLKPKSNYRSEKSISFWGDTLLGNRSFFKITLENDVKHIIVFGKDDIFYLFSADDVYQKYEIKGEKVPMLDNRSFLFGNTLKDDFIEGDTMEKVLEFNAPKRPKAHNLIRI